MARARNIKPGFFKNADLIELHPLIRILFAGLWCLADREGRIEDRPRQIKIEILPMDDCNVDDMLSELDKLGFIKRYTVDGGKYLMICSWAKHQNPHHMELASLLPPPEGQANKYNHSPINKVQRLRIFQRDNYRCLLCGSDKKLSIDHIVHVSKGGTSADDNLRTLCQSCNSSRGARDDESFKARHQVVDDSSTAVLAPLIPDSLNLIPDSLIPHLEVDESGMIIGDTDADAIRRWLGEYTEGKFGVAGDPIVMKMLQLLGDRPIEDFQDFLIGMHKRKLKPDKSYGWFIAMAEDYFGGMRNGNNRR